jgi:NAD(P)-dependent dehydrogenase (short-subunit alcohol dehydrogenase family)
MATFGGRRMAACLVTGANRGIGLELCRQLAERGDDVIAACRRLSPELQALRVRAEAGVDVGDDGSVARFARRLVGQKVDLLIHNAGILEPVSLEQLDLASIRRQFEVNALGPLRLTHALLGNLVQGSRIAILTSLMGSLGDNTSGGHYGYRLSKAAASMVGVSLARDLQHRGIAVAILHPGMVSTAMTGHCGISAEESVRGLLARLDGLNLKNSGTFWHSNGKVLPW